ncbi:DUF4407 domain-containing protein [Actinoplanes sp. CA-142083]|uniref:DUF4407 domain-containing protein n=1 Tax=Actinoplanes sp. CA-142083 TaxID=3239903 RepID=UPI003D9014F7
MPRNHSRRHPLVWLSGADPQLLEYSRQDRNRFAALGALTLASGLATAILAGYGARVVLGFPIAAAVPAGAVVGAVMVLLDRAFLAAARPGTGALRTAVVIGLRGVLAAVLAFVLAVPLVLAIYRTEVAELIAADMQAAIVETTTSYSRQVDAAEAQLVDARAIANGAIPDVGDDPAIKALRNDLATVDKQYQAALAAAQCEFDGTCGTGSGGGGPSYKAKMRVVVDLRANRAVAEKQLSQATAAAIAAKRETAEAEVTQLEGRVDDLRAAESDGLAAARELRRSPSVGDRLEALNRLSDFRTSVRSTWLVFWILLTIFGLLPVLVRFVMHVSRPTLYDWIAAEAGESRFEDAADFEAEVRRRMQQLGTITLSPEEVTEFLAYVRVRMVSLMAGDETAQLRVPAEVRVIEGAAGAEVRPSGGARPEISGGLPATGIGGRPDVGDDDNLERFLVGEAPTRARAGDEFSLVARIIADRPDPDVPSAAMPALAVGPDGVDVVLLVQVDSGLAGTDKLQATVRVPYRRGSAPVRFSLRAVREGLRRIRLSAWLGGTLLAEVELEVSAENHRVDESNQRRTAPIDRLRAEPGELTMQVGFDGARYSFQLISHRLVSEPVVARSLTESPGEAVERTVDMLRRFATPGGGYGAANPYSPATARRWVEETGVGLWQDLVPDPIKEAFWELRDDIGTFTIVCADDRVPWELLYPLSRTEDHGFLAQQFPVVRRVIGQLSSPRISLRDAQFVVPPRAPANASAEVARVREILRRPDGGVISHLDELLGVLDSGGAAGMLHFVCHNKFSLEKGGSSIEMDGGPFVPEMLNRAVTRRSLHDHHPLVFVNACRSAGAAPEYTRMMSWANQFMKAGAGAFVGSLWPVNSDRAAAFAETFYAELASGTPLGPAAMRARAETEDAGDPTWLAYSVYGDSAATAA